MRGRLAFRLAALALVATAAVTGGSPADDLAGICDRFHGGSPPEAGAPETPTAAGETAAAPDDGCEAVQRCLIEARRKLTDPAAATGDEAPANAGGLCAEVLALTPRDLGALVAGESVRLPARSPSESAADSEACLDFLRCVLRWREAGPEPAPPAVEQPDGARSTESWRDDFARICGRTEEAAALPRIELEALVRESEALLERIEALGIPQAKIYAFRLEKCKAFFEYALELQDSRRTRDGGGDG